MAGYGLRPYGGNGGSYFSGGFTEYPILDADTESMFTGDFMVRETNGYVTRLGDTAGNSPTGASAALSTLGVAVGFRYVDSSSTPVWSQTYVGNAGNTDAFAFIADDPDQLFVIQADGIGATAVQADMGENAPVLLFAVGDANTTSGVSGMTLDISAAAVTAALALRLIRIVEDGENEFRSGTETSNVVVRINPIAHAYNQVSVAVA